LRYRKFGRTGLEVSELVFGGGWVGGILIHGGDDVRRTAIRRALDAGINWIDTAASYGQGKSEEALGWLLKEIDDEPYLSTKVGLDLARLDDIPGQIEESLHASLKRLNRQRVDLFWLHNPIRPESGPTATAQGLALSEVLRKGGAAEGLERMRDQGLCRFIGFTGLGDNDCVKQAVGSGRFDAIQFYYNILNPSGARPMPAAWQGQSFDGLLAACKAQGTATMVIRALASGVLAAERRHGREVVITTDADLDTEAARARAALGALGLDPGTQRTPYGTRSQTALRWVLANPDISCTEIGLAELGHLDEALEAAEMEPLPKEALARLEPVYESNFGLG
jgi:L-galactose dehydrogenase/L-glyceraldehyde 3-phosphate reductase